MSDNEAKKEMIRLELSSETAVWLRGLLDSLHIKENIPLEQARKLLAYKDEIVGQLTEPEETAV